MNIRLNKILVLILVLALMSTTAFALPNNSNGRGVENAPGQLKKGDFNDLEGYSWAEGHIERMANKDVIKGVGNGKFMPGGTAKEIETLTMLVRELELEVDENATLPEDYNGKKLKEWMVPYLVAAYEEGLITDEELEDFNPNFPTKRSKAAFYFVRAFGMEDEALDNMDLILEFNDFNAMPEEHIGYVYVAYQVGLVQGYPGNTFQPNKAINRAELAAMMARFDDNFADMRYEGEIKDFSEDFDTITIEEDNENLTFEITTATAIKVPVLENELIEEFVGLTAVVRAEDGTASEIWVKLNKVEGTLLDLNYDDGDVISVDVELDDSTTGTFIFFEEIEIEGVTGDLDEDYIGHSIEMMLLGTDEVVKLEVNTEVDTEDLEDLVEDVEELVEDNYTAETWEDLEIALAAAEDLLAETYPTQGEVNEAYENLEDAIDDLISTVTDLVVEEEDVVTELDNTNLEITVAENTTVEELEDAVESEFNATFTVLDESEGVSVADDVLVTETMVLEVTTEDGTTVVEYTITVE